jgi:DNA-binding CsgD family transcriptional regulator
MGSALAANEPVRIEAGEHFAEPLTKFACAGTPITDPSGGQVVGAIDLTVAAENAHPLLLPVAKQAAWEIEQRLLGDTSPIGRLLHEQFEAARRRARGPLVLVGPYTMVTNSAAAGTVELSDGPLLWEVASRVLRAGARTFHNVVLASGVVVGTDVQAVDYCGEVVGALVWLRAEASADSASNSESGLNVLTEIELGLADLVAAGLTNREVADRLFVSPYTVDADLRHIYRKLNIRSRVELTRMVAAHD